MGVAPHGPDTAHGHLFRGRRTPGTWHGRTLSLQLSRHEPSLGGRKPLGCLCVRRGFSGGVAAIPSAVQGFSYNGDGSSHVRFHRRATAAPSQQSADAFQCLPHLHSLGPSPWSNSPPVYAASVYRGPDDGGTRTGMALAPVGCSALFPSIGTFRLCARLCGNDAYAGFRHAASAARSIPPPTGEDTSAGRWGYQPGVVAAAPRLSRRGVEQLRHDGDAFQRGAAQAERPCGFGMVYTTPRGGHRPCHQRHARHHRPCNERPTSPHARPRRDEDERRWLSRVSHPGAH